MEPLKDQPMSNAMASVRAHGPMPKARSTIRASPTMPPWMANIAAWPLRSARITSKPLMAQTARTCTYGHLAERNVNDPAVTPRDG